MYFNQEIPSNVLHWNYRGFTEFPLQQLRGEETEITDIYLKENLISRLPSAIGRLQNLESLYLSGNDITELPREISELRCLKCLDVSGNRLRCIPDEIGEVRCLKFLILDENELTELPLRIAELRALRYLSVCDNKLQWLPQRPVYNYHHCEFRFWRNRSLKTIPYMLWYHMFRDQQTRSLNIGCLNVPKYQHVLHRSRYRLKLNHGSREWDCDIDCPPQYSKVLQLANGICSPPSLYELCRRKFYKLIFNTAVSLTEKYQSTYSNKSFYDDFNRNNGNIERLQDDFEGFNIDNGNENTTCDINGNSYALKIIPSIYKRRNSDIYKDKMESKRSYYVPADIIEEYFNFLPYFMKQDLRNGPVSRCENIDCKNPIFDYVFYEFCYGKITLIDNNEDVILSAAFCSKSCAYSWKVSKSNIIPWVLLQDR